MAIYGSNQASLGGRTGFIQEGKLFSYRSNILGPADGAPEHPAGFLIEQQGDTHLGVHFHGSAQFQVVVAGSGRLGPHVLRPVTVHYAGQRTPYGPIVPDAGGLWYLTLRPRNETGAYFMPGARALRDPAIPRREAFTEPRDVAGPDRPAAGGVAQAELATLLPPEDDGLAAWMLTLPADTVMNTPAGLAHGGRFHVVVGGTCAHGGRDLAWLDMIWTDATEAPLTVRAGARGAELLVLQFPTDACAHGMPEHASNYVNSGFTVFQAPGQRSATGLP